MGKLTREHEVSIMVKSRRKLKSMRVKGKVFDPMPHNPTTPCAVNACARTRALDIRAGNAINATLPVRKVKVLKSGIRRITYG